MCVQKFPGKLVFNSVLSRVKKIKKSERVEKKLKKAILGFIGQSFSIFYLEKKILINN